MSLSKRFITFALCCGTFTATMGITVAAYADARLENVTNVGVVQQVEEKEAVKTKSFSERLAEKQKLKATNEMKIQDVIEGNAFIPEGTELSLELKDEISSKRNRVGDPVHLVLTQNVIINGTVVIPQGTIAKGKMTVCRKNGFFGRAGKLEFSVDKIMARNGVEIPLKYVGRIKAGHDGGAVVVGTLLSLAGGFLMKGKNVAVPAGTPILATVVQNTDLKATLEELPEAMKEGNITGNSVNISISY